MNISMISSIKSTNIAVIHLWKVAGALKTQIAYEDTYIKQRGKEMLF
jgi:hypothetical protein